MDAGMIGGVVGGVVGLAGGIAGTYFSIRNTRGRRERAFMGRAAAVTWAAILAFLIGLLLLPPPYNALLWVPYGLALAFGIRWMNRRQAQIRAEEQGKT